eukprot:TRINITY_DN3638_c0_g1_i1.p1 TRINITY_DN3638_c0_g1~~TRINITY_DN3638_c0_g1_i1.p1  ORF type:complete len:273 (-),score=20.96 TRINITY_DN3638_c0_g1_i1:503-1321(-)
MGPWEWLLFVVSFISFQLLFIIFCYLQYQLQQANSLNSTPLSFDLSILPVSQDLQVKVNKLTSYPQVTVSIKLREIDQKYINQENENSNSSISQSLQSSVLTAVYEVGKQDMPALCVLLHDQILSQIGQFTEPQWPKGGCIVDYINLVKSWVDVEMSKIEEQQLKQKSYMLVFIDSLSSIIGKPLEVCNPPIGSSSVVYMIKYEQQLVVVMIWLGDSFPNEPPRIKLKYLQKQGRTSSVQMDRWASAWSAEEMADRCFDQIKLVMGRNMQDI